MKAEKFVSKRLLTAAAFAGAVLSAGSLMAGRAVDDAAFNLAIRVDLGADGAVGSSGLGNRLDFSAESPVTATVQAHAGTDPSLMSVPLATPMHPMTTNDCAVLSLPQDSKEEDGSTYVSTTRIDLKNAAVTGSETQTCFVRFRWDGNPYTNDGVRCWIAMNGYNWNSKKGWGIGINQAKGQSYGTTCVVIPQNAKEINPYDQNQSAQRIYPGKWYDLFVTITPSGTNSVVQIDLMRTPTLRDNGTFENAGFKTYTMGTGWGFPKLTSARGWSSDIFLGAETVTSGWTDLAKGNTTPIRTFRGTIANLMIWNRTLTWPERWEVASCHAGAMWSIGAVNGSANEFAATDAADVFDVTNDWRFMRRSLTAENPTLTLKGALPANEAGRGRYVAITPLWENGAAPGTCPVQLAVNGTTVGTFDLRKLRGRNAFVPGEYWTRDADGNATLTITRVAPITGTLSFDAIVVGGSWAFGTVDKKHDEFSAEADVVNQAVAGDTVSKHVRRALISGTTYPTIRFLFYMPPEAAGRSDGLFETALAYTSGSMDSRLSGHASVDLYLNDVRVGGWENVASDSELSLKIPAKFVRAGMNALVLSNATTQATLDGLKGDSGNAVGGWLNFDYYRYTCEKIPDVGLMLILR